MAGPETDSISYELIRSKSNRTFSPVKYLIERTVALVDNVEQCDDV